jgi:hypothetical protein
MKVDWMGGRSLLMALGVLCLGLGAIVAAQLTTGTSFEAPAGGAGPAPASPAPPPRAAAEFTPPPLSQFAETVERPLFSETRRPPETSGEPSGPPKPFEGTLEGVIIVQNEAVALLKVAGDIDVTRVTKGQTIRGWLVVEIHPDRVVLQGERRAEIRLQEDAGSTAGPGAAGTGAPGRPTVPGQRRAVPQPAPQPPAAAQQPRR